MLRSEAAVGGAIRLSTVTGHGPSEVFFLRAVCCSDTQGRLGFPWPPKRGWAKRCATLPWPLRGWALQFLFFLLTRRSPRGGSGCQGGDPAELGSAPRGP